MIKQNKKKYFEYINRDDNRRRYRGLQGLVTNGHCGKEPSVVVAKLPNAILLGAEANISRSFPLPIVVSYLDKN